MSAGGATVSPADARERGLGLTITIPATIEEAVTLLNNQQGVGRAWRSSGWVYAAWAFRSDMVKIGWATNPDARLRSLQASSPLFLLPIWRVRGTRDLEHHLHGAFAGRRNHGEWFRFPEQNRRELIEREAEKYDAT